MFVRATYTNNKQLSLHEKHSLNQQTADRLDTGADEARILKIQASLTDWHDEGTDWRGLAHTPAHDKKEETSPTTKVRVRRDRRQEVASQLGVGRPTPPFRP